MYVNRRAKVDNHNLLHNIICVYVGTCKCACTHKHRQTDTPTPMHAYTHMHTDTNMYTRTHTYRYTHIQTHTHTHKTHSQATRACTNPVRKAISEIIIPLLPNGFYTHLNFSISLIKYQTNMQLMILYKQVLSQAILASDQYPFSTKTTEAK